MSSILSILFVFIGIVYLDGPLRFFLRQRIESCPKMLSFKPHNYEWLEEIERHFSVTLNDLIEIGFETIDCLFLPSFVTDVKTALILLANRAEKDTAMITVIRVHSSDIENPELNYSSMVLYLEFSTRFEDGFVYNTNNATQLPAFLPPLETKMYQFIRIRNAQSLYKAHQAIMNSDSRNRSRKILEIDHNFGGDAVAYLQNAMRNEYESAVADGYLKLSPNGKEYRPTLKGAYLMVWKELWPWKLFRKIKRDRRENQLAAELSRTGIEI